MPYVLTSKSSYTVATRKKNLVIDDILEEFIIWTKRADAVRASHPLFVMLFHESNASTHGTYTYKSVEGMRTSFPHPVFKKRKCYVLTVKDTTDHLKHFENICLD
jgi:hypothetical protein